MRITNNILRENALANIRRGLSEIGVAQQRVSTGLRLNRASDDPAAATTTMSARGSLRAIEQYRRAIDIAEFRGEAEEGVLDQLSDVLTRVKTIGIAQVSGTSDAITRAASRLEVEGLLRHVVQIANTQVNGVFLFGGNDSEVRPYEIDDSGATLAFTSTDPTGSPQVEVSSQQWVPTVHSGTEVFGTTAAGLMRDLQDMIHYLDTDDIDGIESTLRSLDGSLDHVQGLIIENGVRTNHLQMTRANLDAVEMHLLSLKSDLEEVDIEEAVTELVSRQTAFQAAMLATSRIMGLTLTDYLR